MTEQEFLFDYDRKNRIGHGEIILAQGKSTEQLNQLLENIDQQKQPAFLSRLTFQDFKLIAHHWQKKMNYDSVSQTAFFNHSAQKETSELVAKKIVIVTAGSSDVPSAREAERTLIFHGHQPTMMFDLGVAGLWRIESRLKDIKDHGIVIAIAGMDAALPTILGGLIDLPIIGVPTSTGYGAARNGETALMAMLCSCATGLTVVNIDNGLGAATAALRIYNQLK